MNVFITGIAGFLGSHLADHLAAEGHAVTGIDNLFGGDGSNVSPGIAWTEMGMTNPYLIGEMRRHKAEVVFHCAAAAYEGASVFTPHFVSDNVFTGSAAVFTAAINASARRIVNCSSMARYGVPASAGGFDESATCRPVDPYGISKLAAEDLLKNLAEVHGIEWNIAVPHNIYGPRQRYVDPYRNVAAIMTNLMLQKRAPVIFGDGTQTRCFSYVDDVVPCLARLGTDRAIVGEVVNIGPDEEPVDINTLAAKLARIIGFKGAWRYVDARPQEVHTAVCSADKSRRLLGYETTTSLDDGLDRLVAFVRHRAPRPFQYHFDVEIKTPKTPKVWTERYF